jgi:hypothetical protein
MYATLLNANTHNTTLQSSMNLQLRRTEFILSPEKTSLKADAGKNKNK